MPKAYIISAYNAINDPDKLKAYAEGAGPAVAAFGGKFLARSGNVTTLEGNEKLRAVIIEFESVEKAKECYNSDAYQAAHAKMAGGAVDRDMFVVEAVE
ncbi:MAG: DUF1330 domain-containing protein [Proteobacteria bacterium]|nr:DUF1330 domain-containing protein [Pseudomonadota bacterium]